MALYNWKDGELVTAEKLNAYGEGMEQLKTDTVSAKTATQAAAQRAEDAVAHNPTVQNGIWYV